MLCWWYLDLVRFRMQDFYLLLSFFTVLCKYVYLGKASEYFFHHWFLTPPALLPTIILIASLWIYRLTCGSTSSQSLTGRAAVDGENSHLVLGQRVQVVQLHTVLVPLDHLKHTSHRVSDLYFWLWSNTVVTSLKVSFRICWTHF